MLMFAGAAASALDLLSSLAKSKAPALAQAGAKATSAATTAFDLAGQAVDTGKKAAAANGGTLPPLSPDTMNTLLLTLLDTDKDGQVSGQELKSALAQNAKSIERVAAAPGQSLSVSA